MKTKIKQLFSGFLSTIITVSSIQLPVSYGEGDIERYPYTFFAGASTDGAITINADNVCINGNIATNGTISSPAVNFQVNGTKSEKLNETMIQCFGIIDETFFAASEVETYFEDYFLEETNINVDTPIEAEGNINLTGNISISSGLKALHNVNLNGNVENSQYSAIYSQTGDIIIDTDNLNLNGIVYAPNGAVNISAMNLNLNSVIIIADTITITCPNLNANYNAPIGEIIGKGSKTEENNENNESNEEELELIAFGEYLEDDKLKIYWDTTVPQGSFDIQISDNGENYISIDTVNDADSYEYTLSESLTQQYIKVVETTNAGKIGESIPFLITHNDEGYDISFLDSDEDELPDLYELRIGTQIDNADSDEDGLSDYQEAFVVGSDPTIYDSITEGLADSEADSDCDGLSNIYEITIKTNPQNSDTDEDMLSDYDELFVYFTDPLVADSDEDGIEDGSEIKLGLDPNNPETFGIPDAEYKVKQSISSDNELLSAINTEESPYELSIEMKTNGDIEKEVNVLASGYSNVIDNDALLGASLDISASDMCSPEDIVIKYDIKSDYIDNTLGKYSSLAEFQGIKRLNVFKFDEEEGMLLPVNTEFSEDSTQLYAEVDELGTYCIMDMEIWLDNLGVEMPEMNTNISPLRLTYSAAANILATNNSKSKPIDMVFILQTAGYDVDTFEKEKELISELSKYVFEEYSKSTNVNVHIITYGMDSSSCVYINKITTYAKLKRELNEITYNDIKNEYCDRSRAFNKLFNMNFVNSDLYIYHLINGNSTAKEQYYFYEYDGVNYFCHSDNIEYINLNYGKIKADSEIFPSSWGYSDENLQRDLKDVITSNNDLFTSIDNVDISVLEEHFESKKTDPIRTYSIMLPTKWKKITLKEKLTINGKTNSDTDALTDWEEVDTSRLIWHNTNSFEVPTITVSDIIKNIDRFKSKSEYKFLLDNSQKIKYLPVLSDPTDADTDDDGLKDDEDFDRLTVAYYDLIQNLQLMEKYVDEYMIVYSSMANNHKTENSTVVINILRNYNYGTDEYSFFKYPKADVRQSVMWTLTDGYYYPEFKKYINQKNPSVLNFLRNYTLYDCNENKVDFLHMLTTLGAERFNFTDPNLAGWAGDLQSFIRDLKVITYGQNLNSEELKFKAFEIISTYKQKNSDEDEDPKCIYYDSFGIRDPKFTYEDFYADLDAKNINSRYSESQYLSSVLKHYYTYNCTNRINDFIVNMGGEEVLKDTITKYTRGNHCVKHLILHTFAKRAANTLQIEDLKKISIEESDALKYAFERCLNIAE